MVLSRDTFNLEKQFIFYASYHSQPVNVAIHILCVWPILATAILFLQYTPSISGMFNLAGLPMGAYLQLNLALAVTAMYAVIYIVMDPTAGGLGAFLVFLIYMVSSKLVVDGALVFGYPVWAAAVAVHVACWILQFIGHGLFEGRAPALLDSADQAFLTAPLFVLLEILFFFGYRKDFYQKMMKTVEKNIREFKAGKVGQNGGKKTAGNKNAGEKKKAK